MTAPITLTPEAVDLSPDQIAWEAAWLRRLAAKPELAGMSRIAILLEALQARVVELKREYDIAERTNEATVRRLTARAHERRAEAFEAAADMWQTYRQACIDGSARGSLDFDLRAKATEARKVANKSSIAREAPM